MATISPVNAGAAFALEKVRLMRDAARLGDAIHGVKFRDKIYWRRNNDDTFSPEIFKSGFGQEFCRSFSLRLNKCLIVDGMQSSQKAKEWSERYVTVLSQDGRAQDGRELFFKDGLVEAFHKLSQTYEQESKSEISNNYLNAAQIIKGIALTKIAVEEAAQEPVSKDEKLLKECGEILKKRTMPNFEQDIDTICKSEPNTKLGWTSDFRPEFYSTTPIAGEALRYACSFYKPVYGHEASIIAIEWVEAYLTILGITHDLPDAMTTRKTIAERFIILASQYSLEGKNGKESIPNNYISAAQKLYPALFKSEPRDSFSVYGSSRDDARMEGYRLMASGRKK